MTILCKKSVYAPASAKDGFRLIVMRRYPRGYAKARAHAWLPELAPTLPLVHWYHEHLRAIRKQWEREDSRRCEEEITRFWRSYSRRYLAEMKAQRRLIEFFATLHRDFGMTFTLLCACTDRRICHRSLLAGLMRAAARARRA